MTQNITDPEAPQAAGVPVGHQGARVDVAERPSFAVNGFLALAAGVALLASAAYVFVKAIPVGEVGVNPSVGRMIAAVVLFVLALLILSSIVVVQPGQSKVIQFFGRYIGTNRRTGLAMVAPLTTKKRVSLRVNNFETNALKVNDASGNPVEIACIVVWQVADTAKASFSVEDYQGFVRVQSEAALRHVATSHPYDDAAGDGESLRGSTDVVSGELAQEVAARVAVAGVEIIEVRISHLAYAPEIAQAMLRRQQASAVVAARAKIVEGAVGMVEMALAKLEEESIVDLDDERRAAMVSNLLVVLCSEQNAAPVLNAGSLYT